MSSSSELASSSALDREAAPLAKWAAASLQLRGTHGTRFLGISVGSYVCCSISRRRDAEDVAQCASLPPCTFALLIPLSALHSQRLSHEVNVGDAAIARWKKMSAEQQRGYFYYCGSPLRGAEEDNGDVRLRSLSGCGELSAWCALSLLVQSMLPQHILEVTAAPGTTTDIVVAVVPPSKGSKCWNSVARSAVAHALMPRIHEDLVAVISYEQLLEDMAPQGSAIAIVQDGRKKLLESSRLAAQFAENPPFAEKTT